MNNYALELLIFNIHLLCNLIDMQKHQTKNFIHREFVTQKLVPTVKLLCNSAYA